MTDAGVQLPEVVELEHKFFEAFSESYFRKSAPPDEKPVFCAMLGDQEVSLPLGGIISELALEKDNPVRIMIETISKSLRFVNVLRPGDAVPAELRTGDASWEAGADHLQVANQRLTMQLVTWASGRESMITDPCKLQQLLDDPGTKQKVTDAFRKAADQLRLDDPDEVAKMVENFAEELAYVEALRERFGQVHQLFQSLNKLRKSYLDQNGLVHEIDPVLRLMKKPIADYQSRFSRIDAQTGNILTVLSNLDVQRDYVSGVRNEMYVRLEAWQEIIERWRGVNPLYPQDFNIGKGLRDLYRFLAQRYMEVDEWILMTSAKDTANSNLRYGGVMMW